MGTNRTRFFCSVIAFVAMVGVVSTMLFTLTHRAQAQVGPVPTFDGANLAANTTAAKALTGLFAKENIFDGIMVEIGKQIIRHMTQSIVTWINGGFEGPPAFVSNPEAFFTDLADQVTGTFINRLGLGFLCQQYDFSIRYALQLDFNFGGRGGYLDRYACTANAVIDNISSGEIVDLDGFFDVAVTTSNNPYGAYVAAKEELAIQIFSQQQVQRDELSWGNGFLSLKDANGNITTPGNIIEGQLSNVLGSDLRQLELADEINEIIGALANQLMSQVITKGISGLSSAVGDGSGSIPINVYADINSQTDETTDISTQISDGLSNNEQEIQSGIDGGEQYIDTSISDQYGEQAAPQRRNIALQGTAQQSATHTDWVASGAIDGSKQSYPGIANGAAFDPGDFENRWWHVDLGREYPIDQINVYRHPSRNSDHLANFFVVVSQKPIVDVPLVPDILRQHIQGPRNQVLYYTLSASQQDTTHPDYRGITAIKPDPQTDLNYYRPYRSLSDSTLIVNFDESPVGRYIAIVQTPGTPWGMWLHELEVYPNNAPIINVQGSSRVNLAVGETFRDPGVEVLDTEDVTIALSEVSARMVDSGGALIDTYTLDTPPQITGLAPGDYTITYTVSDSGGVAARAKTRALRVQE